MRTRHKAPETNGVVGRFFGALKYEHLYRNDIADGAELAEHVGSFLDIYNAQRPHEALNFARPLNTYLTPPDALVQTRHNVPIP